MKDRIRLETKGNIEDVPRAGASFLAMLLMAVFWVAVIVVIAR